MLSKADSVPGQGVGSAYLEQVNLVKELENFDIEINSKQSDFDIYHIHSVNLRYRLRMNKKHINVMYVHFVPSMNDGSIKLWKPIQKIFDRYVNRMYKKADELVVVNPAFIPPLLELGIKSENITYIPNYVDHKNFRKLDEKEVIKLKEKYGVPGDKFVVLGCGQIQRRKGFDDFIKVAEDNPDITFLWAGGFSFGRITDGYKKYKKIVANPPQNVKFLGIIDRNLMNEVYNISDVLFMPSYLELFPMTILEVANVGKPILLRKLDLYKPILFDNYLDGTNTDIFSLQIRSLRNDKKLYDEYSNKSKKISEIYSKENLLKQWGDYYLRIYEKNKLKYNK